MKYSEIILIALFAALICALWFNQPKDTNTEFKRYQDSLNAQISILKDSFAVLSKIETTQIIKKTTINHYYDSTKTIIINLPDSANFDLLRANIERYNYLSQPSPSQGY